MDRAKVIFAHLEGGGANPQVSRTLKLQPSSASKHTDNDDDVVICSALRTACCKARRGQFKDTLPDDLLAAVFTGVIKETGLSPSLVGDICVGNVMQPGAGANMARMAQFFAGIPETTPLNAVNRQCSSGLQAVAHIAASIKAGYCDIGIGAGVESMSVNRMDRQPEGFVLNPRVMDVDKARDCLIPMGQDKLGAHAWDWLRTWITSENVAAQYNISRETQDRMAVESHAKAHRAQKNGWFREEIIPVTTVITDKEGNEKAITVTDDDGIRPGTTMATLARLRPAFQEDGSTTAGNSSQLTDGAAAVLLARRSAARKHNLPVFGVFRSFAVVGVPPDVMGIGPAYAIPEALKKAGLSIEDIDVFEINEAFASQATYCMEHLGIPREKLNPNGGAIAMGHPLGCTGSRQIATLLHHFKRNQSRAYGVVSMCIGTGMGAAAVIEYPGN